jgi:hypothetical protein
MKVKHVPMRYVKRNMKCSGCIPRVKIRKLALEARKVHTSVDEALSVLSINTALIKTVSSNSHMIDKYIHGMDILQGDFSIASKVFILSKIASSFFSNNSQKKVNVAIYILVLLLVIFVSDT